jgi:ElaB/YqjD/DUF883 family membrane-anchored ribosome-binding protein
MAEPEKPKATTKAAAPKAAKPKAAPKMASTTKPKAAPKTMIKAKPSNGKAEDMKSKVKDDMNNFKTKAADGARAAAEKGKDRATEAVASISKLIRDSAATIDQNVGKQYGDYARSAADSVEGFAGKMEAKDVDDIVGEAREFVRKSPAVAIGAAAAIGFVLARLVRSGRDDA